MTVKLLVLVRADGTTSTLDIKKVPWPSSWLVIEGIPYQRADIAWRPEERADEPHGALVYTEVEPGRYEKERACAIATVARAERALAEMPKLSGVAIR
jgi:hypothetical protein